MKKQKINIDNYFEQARNSQVDFDISDARGLIEKHPKVPDTALKHTTNNIGNKIMNILAFTAAASAIWLMSLGYFGEDNTGVDLSDNRKSEKLIIPSKTDETTKAMPAKDPKIEKYIAYNQSDKKQTKTPDDKKQQSTTLKLKNTSTNSITNTTVVEVKGVNIIDLSGEQLAKLGFTFKGDNAEVWLFGKKSPQKVIINKDLVQLQIQSKNNETNSEEIPDIWPKMITDAQGNKHFLAFEGEYANSALINYQDEKAFAVMSENGESVEKAIKTIVTSYHINTDSSSANKQDLSFMFDSLNGNTHDIQIDYMELGESQEVEINAESLRWLQKFGFDSTFNDPDKMKIIMRRFTDTNITRSLPSLRTDSTNKPIMVKSRIAFQNNLQEDDTNSDDILKHKASFASDIEEDFNKYVRVNKLIPIRVILNDADKTERIFWYDPTEELLEILPDDIAANIEPELAAVEESDEFCEAPATGGEKYFDVWRACSGAVENLEVYPNPTTGPINLKFILKEKRHINISLHDLNGRMVQNLYEWQKHEAGAINLNITAKQQIEAGIYLVVVRTDMAEQAVQRLIIE